MSIMGFAHVTLHDHASEKVKKFDRAILGAPQVLECHATSGEHDYMLKVVAPDMASYQDFLSEYLLKIGVVRTVNTSFVLKQQKNTLSTRSTAIPFASPMHGGSSGRFILQRQGIFRRE